MPKLNPSKCHNRIIQNVKRKLFKYPNLNYLKCQQRNLESLTSDYIVPLNSFVYFKLNGYICKYGPQVVCRHSNYK
jgi:hypothetical protein